MNIVKSLFNKKVIFNFLFSCVLVHIIFGSSFTNTIYHEYEISQSLFSGNMPYSSYNVDTPVFHILGFLFNIEDFRFFSLMVFTVTSLLIYVICLNLEFLQKNSTVFLFSGWLVTVSWFMGYSDIFTSLFLILIVKEILFKRNYLIIFLYSALLTISHYGIALFSLIIVFVLFHKKREKLLGLTLFSSFITGRIILQVYLNTINYGGRSRLRFVFNENVLDQVFYLSSSNSIDLILSGFLGVMLYLILFIYFSEDGSKKIRIIMSFLFALIGSSLALDTSRVFSMLVIPISLFVLYYFYKNVELNSKRIVRFLPYLSFIILLIIDERHLFGSIYNESPNQENIISIYSIVTEFVNNLMRNIW